MSVHELGAVVSRTESFSQTAAQFNQCQGPSFRRTAVAYGVVILEFPRLSLTCSACPRSGTNPTAGTYRQGSDSDQIRSRSVVEAFRNTSTGPSRIVVTCSGTLRPICHKWTGRSSFRASQWRRHYFASLGYVVYVI